MAELRKITIEIINKESGEENPNPANPLDSPKEEKKSEKTTAKSILMNQAYEQAKKLVQQAVNNGTNRYFSLSENYMAEQDYQNTMNTIFKVSGLGLSIYAGAKLGSVGGPWGAAIGATISAAGYGISQYLNNQSRISSYYQSLNASNFQTNFSRQRAGLISGGKGTEN